MAFPGGMVLNERVLTTRPRRIKIRNFSDVVSGIGVVERKRVRTARALQKNWSLCKEGATPC